MDDQEEDSDSERRKYKRRKYDDPTKKNLRAAEWACKNGHLPLLKMAIAEFSIDLNLHGDTFMSYACNYGQIEVVKFLAEVCNVNPSYKNKNTPEDDEHYLRTAMFHDHLDVVIFLLQDSRVDPSTDNNYCLRRSSKRGYLELITLLLKNPRVDPSDLNGETLSLASKNGHLEIVKLLLQDPRVDPSSENNTPLFRACSKNRVDVVKLLLQDPRVSPASNIDKDHFRKVCENGCLELVELFLKDPRVDPTYDDYAAFYGSMKNRHPLVTKLLYDDERVGKNVMTYKTMKYAAEFGFYYLLRLLLNDPSIDLQMDRNAVLNLSISGGRVVTFMILLQDYRVSEGLRYDIYGIYAAFNSLMRRPGSEHKINAMTAEFIRHPNFVLIDNMGESSYQIKRAVNNRLQELRATHFCMKEIGNGWADIAQEYLIRCGKIHY